MIAVVPIEHLNILAEKALQVAYGLSENVHILHIEEEHSDRDFSSEWQLVESRWYYSFLHNRRAAILRTVLLLKGRNRILIINVPWNLGSDALPRVRRHTLKR